MSQIKNHLITIPTSHYCEKARWALEWSEIPYIEDRHLQGFHLWAVHRAARTDTAPVLTASEKVLTDSSDILQWCDTEATQSKKIYPVEPSLRQAVIQFEDDLDEGLGVDGRLWMYTYMLDELPLILRYSKIHGVPKYQLKLMPIVFPFIRKFISRTLNLTPSSEKASRLAVDEVFNQIAEQLSDGRRFLFGDDFTAADLTFAALSASVLIPENYGVSLPSLGELPEPMRKQVEKWRAHPAGQFALKIYSEFRGSK